MVTSTTRSTDPGFGDSPPRTAIITGSAGGIGAATARRLAEDGVQVFLIDRSPQVEQVADELRTAGAAASSAVMDVTDTAHWGSALRRCRAELGAPTALVSNAYTVQVQPIERTTLDSWRTQLDVNLTGTFLGVKTLLDDLRAAPSTASIVLVSSVHAHVGLPGRAAYAATKAGLTGLTRQLAVEYAPQIRVNAVLPGPILTPAWKDIGEDDRRASAEATAMGRIGEPREVADAIAYLCSDRASFITGVELPVDGGWLVTKNSS